MFVVHNIQLFVILQIWWSQNCIKQHNAISIDEQLYVNRFQWDLYFGRGKSIHTTACDTSFTRDHFFSTWCILCARIPGKIVQTYISELLCPLKRFDVIQIKSAIYLLPPFLGHVRVKWIKIDSHSVVLRVTKRVIALRIAAFLITRYARCPEFWMPLLSLSSKDSGGDMCRILGARIIGWRNTVITYMLFE